MAHHLTLQIFKPVDLALSLTIAPAGGQGSPNGGVIVTDASCEGHQILLADYTAEERSLLLRSLRAAPIAISAASPGRKTETVSEGFAAASYIMEVREPYLANSLIGSIQYEVERGAHTEQKFPDYVELATAAGAEQTALDTLAAVAAMLNVNTTPEEAGGFKHWLLDIAAKTTEAGKEGGNFLGWGAVAVNDEERAALQKIATVLGISPAAQLP